jgi:uncharacterized protein (DUF302 family)
LLGYRRGDGAVALNMRPMKMTIIDHRRKPMMIQKSRNVMTVILPAMTLYLGLTLGTLHHASAAEDIVTQTVEAPFDKVVTNLKRQITGHKLVIVKEVPFQQMLAMVGVKTEPMMGFEIFHPRYGKVIYENDPAAFKDAPLRILVIASGDRVSLEYRKPSVVFDSYSGLSDLGTELDTVFADIVAGVAK